VLSTVASSTPLTLDIAIDDAVAGGHRVIAPSAEMKQAASEIARQCLHLWDGFLGIHAGSDSAGAKAGVWRGNFDGVRCAVLLLAFRKLNKSLQMNSDAPSRFGMLSYMFIHIDALSDGFKDALLVMREKPRHAQEHCTSPSLNYTRFHKGQLHACVGS